MFVNPGKTKGFTLIELLITISILAVLSTIGMLMYQGVLSKTRDATRKSDLNKLASALEIYYQSNNKFVVNSNGSDLITCDPSTSSPFYNAIKSNLSDGVAPPDPSTGKAYCYLSSSNGQSFTLCAKLENLEPSNPLPLACTTAEYNYIVVPK